MSTKTLITAEEFARIPEPEGESLRMELDEGPAPRPWYRRRSCRRYVA